MLSTVFSFRGRINRLQYFLGSLGLGFAEVILVGVAGLLFLALRAGMGDLRAATLCLVLALPALPAVAWIGFSLQARRFRDIGWEPVFVIPAWIFVLAVDRAFAGGITTTMFSVEHMFRQTILGQLFNLAMVLCLLFWPGRTYADDFLDPGQPVRASRPAEPAPAPARSAAGRFPASPAVTGFGRRGLN
jgi:uncharacterized membrane protein YhaH (DUF805 family)